MTDRRSTKDVLWLALQCAKNDRHAFAESQTGDREAEEDAMKDVAAFERLQKKLFGTTKSRLESKISRMQPMSLSDIKKMIEE